MAACKRLLLGGCILFYSTGLYGQINLIDKKIKLNKYSIRLDSAILIIKQQTKAEFTYNPESIKWMSRVNVKNTSPTLRELLDAIAKSSRLTYRIMDTHIVFTSSLAQVKPEKPSRSLKGNSISEPTVLEPVASSSPLAASTPKVDSTQSSEKNLDAVHLAGDPLPSTPIKTLETSEQKPGAKQIRTSSEKKPKNESLFTPFVKAGFMADEIFYSSARVNVGFPLLFAEGSLSTNYKVRQFRYGVGTSANMGNKFKLSAIWTTGNSSDFFIVKDSLESAKLNVKDKLNKLTVGAEWKLKQNLVLDFGLTWNQLKSSYTLADSASTPADYNKNFSTKFYTIKPPYVLKNEHNTNSTTRTWIGFYVSVSYRFSFSRKR